jgi:hypothetical protein
MKKILFFSFLLTAFAGLTGFAQYTISGTILDSTTREPLVKASVFCQNTTLGTVTNKDGAFSLTMNAGGYDLIFSYTGYQTQTLRVTGESKLEILMVKEEKSMGEVVIKSSNEVPDGWQKYGDFFLENFIGSTPNASLCQLDNPEALHFYFFKKSNRLKVTASDPLIIANYALGYNLRYQLDSFVYYYNNSSSTYRGYCLFTEMDGPDSLQAKWTINRKKAYLGSKLHFMRSYYDSTVIEDGWIIDMLEENNDKKFVKVKDIYDTLYYGALDSTNQIEIYFPRKISVTYTKKRPEYEYLKKMNMQKSVPWPISYIDIKQTIAITRNGYFYNQEDWINQGYWSWKNIADMVPYDYMLND